MRLHRLLVAATLTTASMTGGISAQEPPAASASQDSEAPAKVATPSQDVQDAHDGTKLNLPVSLDHIRKALERQPARPLLRLPDQPTFRIEIQERNRLQELLATLDVKSGPIPAGGVYAAEIQRIMFPSVSNPLVQPYAAFNQPELLTIIIENLIGKYLISKALSAISATERERAEEAAREEVRRTIAQYCASQPNNGASIKICANLTH
jgi:hypothetical protein